MSFVENLSGFKSCTCTCSNATNIVVISIISNLITLFQYSFLSVYDLHFTKQDHIHLIGLLYHLVVIPDIDSSLLYTWCSLLCKLLRYPCVFNIGYCMLVTINYFDVWLQEISLLVSKRASVAMETIVSSINYSYWE